MSVNAFKSVGGEGLQLQLSSIPHHSLDLNIWFLAS